MHRAAVNGLLLDCAIFLAVFLQSVTQRAPRGSIVVPVCERHARLGYFIHTELDQTEEGSALMLTCSVYCLHVWL